MRLDSQRGGEEVNEVECDGHSLDASAIFIQWTVVQQLHLNASKTHSWPEWTVPVTMPVSKLKKVLRMILREKSAFLRNKPKGGGLIKVLKVNRK